MNLLLLSELRIVSGSHWISSRSSLVQFCDRQMMIWSMWMRVLSRRNQPFAVPIPRILQHAQLYERHGHLTDCNFIIRQLYKNAY